MDPATVLKITSLKVKMTKLIKMNSINNYGV